MAEHVSDDLEQAAQKTEKAAKTGKAIAKTAAKAAAGDYLGAAKEALSDEGLRKTGLFALVTSLCIFILILIVMFAAPIAIYEGLKNFTDNFETRWEELYYSDDRNRFVAAISATVTGTVDAFKGFWNSITTGHETYSDDGVLDKDPLDTTDLLVMGGKEPLTVTYQKKIDAVIAKLQSRQHQIISAIEDSASGSTKTTNNVNGWVYQNLYKDRDEAFYKSLGKKEGAYKVSVVYGGVKVNAAYQDISKRDAIKLIALFSAQYNSDLDNIKPSSLMKWLGYRAGSEKRTFTVGGSAGILCSIKGWKGEFMPQYLVDQMMQNPEYDYSIYKAPAADIILFCDTEDLATLKPSVTVDKNITYETKTVTTWRWMVMPDDYYLKNYNYDPSEIPEPDTPMPAPFVSPDGRGGFENWHWYYIREEKTETTQKIEMTYTLTYSMSVCVGVRSLDVLADLAGFYEERN